ncbi:MAG: penicillin-binding protein 2 [Acidimicrobiales bacterium]
MSASGKGGPEPPDRPRDPRRSRDPASARVPRGVQAPYFPADEEGERHRTRIVSSSPLKRLEDEEREQQRRLESARFGLRLTIMGLIVLVAFSAVVVRLWSLQVLHSSHYRNAALVFQQQTVPITPARGLIIARGGQVLVGDQVLPVVTLSRSEATQVVIGRLAALLGESVPDVDTALANPQASPYQPVPIAIGVPQSTIVYLSEHKAMFSGVSVNFTAERTYPQGDTAAQVLGYTGDIDEAELHSLAKYGYSSNDVVGQSGVEATDELWLRGRPGSEVIKVDASGNPVGTVKTVPPVSGDDVVLNIDLNLQQVVERSLTDQIGKLQASGLPADSGAAVVLDPETGAVLAMASVPTYDPSWWVGGISYQHYQLLTSQSDHDPLLNRAIQGLWAPGSTFKLATATAALNDGLLASLGGYIDDRGYYQIGPPCSGQCLYYNNLNEKGQGPINVTTALTVSDDVFFYTLGADYWYDSGTYGQMPVQDVAEEYGFGRLTGIDLPNEYSGQVDSKRLRLIQHSEDAQAFPSTYYGIADNIEMAFGQGETLVTPLQEAVAYGTFATGGTRYAPQVVNAIVSPTGKVVRQFKPRVMGHVELPPGTYEQVLNGLEGAVHSPNGTAYATFQGYNGMPLAGKTGTATESSNTNVQPTAWFVAFGPTSAPRYVVAVVIDQAGYGAQAAAPVARQIFNYLTNNPIGPADLHPPANAP